MSDVQAELLRGRERQGCKAEAKFAVVRLFFGRDAVIGHFLVRRDPLESATVEFVKFRRELLRLPVALDR